MQAAKERVLTRAYDSGGAACAGRGLNLKSEPLSPERHYGAKETIN